ADACNIMQIDPFGGGLLSPEAVAYKVSVLRSHCEDFGRPFETILRTYTTGWTILAQDEAALQAKLAHYFPERIEQRYQGAWRDYVFHATPIERSPLSRADPGRNPVLHRRNNGRHGSRDDPPARNRRD